MLALIILGVTVISSHHENGKEVGKQCYRMPKENTYVGSVIFSDGEVQLLGSEFENGEQVKRVGGLYVIRFDGTLLTVEIYTWGTRTLFKKERYNISELKQKYPPGVSIWVEQDQTSATVVLVPWQ